MSGRFFVRVLVPAAAILSLAAQPAWANGSVCWNPDEIPAARLHAFHTMLMVGALRCRDVSPDAIKSYDAFAAAHNTALEASSTVVQAHFIRSMGSQAGATEFRNFDTRAGNLVSVADHDALRCESIGAYARMAAGASEADLYTLARLSDQGGDIRACTPGAPVAALATAGATAARPEGEAVPEVAAVIPAAAPAAEPGPAPAAPPTAEAPLPEMQTASVSEPATIAQETVSEPPAGQVDAATALADAARALSAAASALRSASTADR